MQYDQHVWAWEQYRFATTGAPWAYTTNRTVWYS